TATVLELRAGIDALIADLDRAVAAYVALAGRHRRTATMARTSLQHAQPMPFGLKVAGYAGALARSRERLKRLRKEALVLQLGGTSGTLAILGERAFDVYERLAALILNSEIHEHERAAGAWQAEWLTFPPLLLIVSGALAGIADIGEGLQVDNDRMRANLDATRGVIMAEAVTSALIAKLGKPIA